MITLRDVADAERIARIVDHRQTPAWRRAGLRNPPLEGPDTYTWMTRTSPGTRAEQVRAALLEERPWAPLVQNELPKPARWKEVSRAARTGRAFVHETRGVTQDARVDHARQLVLKEVLEPLIEKKLSRVAVAYRPGVAQHGMILDVIDVVVDPENGFNVAATLDIRACFDCVSWKLLDRAIDRHLGRDVEEDVRAQLKARHRTPVVGRSGKSIERDRGILQGAVLAPLLLNLFLTDFDGIVQRIIAQWGCLMWRSCDDMLVVAPDRESLLRAIETIERELARVRLDVKAATKRMRDLHNPQNPAVWLGFAFTKGTGRRPPRTWVPRERIERKAASLLQEMLRGRLDREGVQQSLAGLRAHYIQIVHPDDADHAVAAIEKLLLPYLNRTHLERKEGIHHTRQQLKVRQPAGRTQPALRGDPYTKRQVTFPTRSLETGSDQGKGHLEQEAKAPSLSSKGMEGASRPATETPRGGSAHEPRTSPSLSPPPHDEAAPEGEEARSPTQRDQVLPAPRDTGVLSSTSGFSLASTGDHRSLCSPAPDQARHRSGLPGKSKLAGEEHSGLEVTVSIQPLGKRRGRLRLDYSDGVTHVHQFRASRAGSPAEVVLAGYRTALRLLRSGVGHVVFGVRDATVAGYVDGRYVVRSPDTLLRWELLLKEVDGLDRIGVSSDTHGRQVAWRRSVTPDGGRNPGAPAGAASRRAKR